jgi:anti-anti-sigma factor
MPEAHVVAVSTIKDVTVAKITSASVLDAVQIERIGEDLCTLADNPFIHKIILDAEAVTHLSSAALGMLINVQRRCAATKGRLIIAGLQPTLRKIFKLSNLEKMFTFAEDRSAALKEFGAGG